MRGTLRLFYAFRLLATSYLYVPIFMLFQASRGLDFSDGLALGGIYCGVVIVVEVPTGVLADRLGRRRAMFVGALAMVATCLVAAAAHTFATFALAESLAAISMALCSGADSAYLYDLLAAHDQTRDYARHESIASAWHLAGSAIACAGGGALAQLDIVLPYYATAAVAVIAAVIALALPEEGRSLLTQLAVRNHAGSLGAGGTDQRPARRTLHGWTRDMGHAVTEVARNGRLAWLVGYSAVVFVLLRATLYIYQPYLAHRGLGVVGIGLVYAAGFVVAAAVASRTHVLRTRFGDDVLLWALLGALAASFLGLAGAAPGPWLLGLLVVQAIANGIFSPLTKPLLNREIADSSRRAAVLSVESMARRAAMGVFSPLVGLYGESNVMMLCGAVGIGGLVVLAMARIRRGVPEPVDPR
jgi:MFS family permease